jgi:hypothetical protein
MVDCRGHTSRRRRLSRHKYSIADRNWLCPRQTSRRDWDDGVSKRYMGLSRDKSTYKKPKRELFVEIDAELKAEHCVEPESEMQPWAMAPGAVARMERRAVVLFIRGPRCVRGRRDAFLEGMAASRARSSCTVSMSQVRWRWPRSSRSSPSTCRWCAVMFRSETGCLKLAYSRPCVASLGPDNFSSLPSSPRVVACPKNSSDDADKNDRIRIPKSLAQRRRRDGGDETETSNE